MECPVCKKVFNEHTGRRPKKFCSDACKVKFFNAIKIKKAKIEKGGKAEVVLQMQYNGGKWIEKDRIVVSEWETKQMKERLEVVKGELANPPKNPIIGLRKWIAVRENEIKELESKLNQ